MELNINKIQNLVEEMTAKVTKLEDKHLRDILFMSGMPKTSFKNLQKFNIQLIVEQRHIDGCFVMNRFFKKRGKVLLNLYVQTKINVLKGQCTVSLHEYTADNKNRVLYAKKSSN